MADVWKAAMAPLCADDAKGQGAPQYRFQSTRPQVAAMTAPRSLRELFDQIGPREVSSPDGGVIMEMPVDERVTNSAGGLQGGLIATMADVTAGQPAARITPFGNGIATTDLFIRYLRPIKIGPARASPGFCVRARDRWLCRSTYSGVTTTNLVPPRP